MSVSREDIKKGMKQDAAAAWAKIKKLAGRWWVYGAVALGVGGSSAPLPEQNASLGASPFEQSLNEGSRRLENKLKISEMKKRAEAEKQFVSPLRPHAEEQTFADWNMIAGNLQEIPCADENVQQKAAEICRRAMGTTVTGNLPLAELMQKTGVTKTDIQAVVDNNPALLYELSPGETNRKLARAAGNIKDETVGKCTLGVQNIFGRAGMGEILSGNNPDWPQKEPGAGRSNSGCNVYIPLEKSGLFTTVSIENKAYSRVGRKENKTAENQEMNDFIRRLPPGTTISIDNRVDEFSGRRLPKDNQGIIHGHTCVINNRHNPACDYEQRNGVNFNRYGPKVNISLSKDMEASQKFAELCIEAKLTREQKEKKALRSAQHLEKAEKAGR